MKCTKCKKGYIKKIDVAPTVAEGIFCVATLGLGGDGGSSYHECQNCFARFNF